MHGFDQKNQQVCLEIKKDLTGDFEKQNLRVESVRINGSRTAVASSDFQYSQGKA